MNFRGAMQSGRASLSRESLCVFFKNYKSLSSPRYTSRKHKAIENLYSFCFHPQISCFSHTSLRKEKRESFVTSDDLNKIQFLNVIVNDYLFWLFLGSNSFDRIEAYGEILKIIS